RVILIFLETLSIIFATISGTMKTEIHQNFPEVKGKIVEIVELSVESDYYGITIRFQDKTTLTFAIEPCLATLPVYSERTDGEEKIVKEYPPVRSEVSSMESET